MASNYSKPPIEPFCQPPDDVPRPERTLYTVSKEDQERLARYLPPKRIDFLPEKLVPQVYTIISNEEQPYKVLDGFTERLKRETDSSTLVIVKNAATQWVGYWYQKLTPEQAEAFQDDPAVCWATYR
jgi:2,5-diamino-6-(ribosylamino)-4(3H)-pyrimidinone 5'-phosphate reductase